ncbi:MAG: glycosyltransferase, partial [Nitrospiraceae bacterium]
SMACATPVVGFEVGGIPDMVQHGTTGLLAKPHDAQALAHAINELLKNPQRRSLLSANCRRVAVHRYSLARQATRYYQLYKQLLASPA